jgi:hypothetical protein
MRDQHDQQFRWRRLLLQLTVSSGSSSHFDGKSLDVMTPAGAVHVAVRDATMMLNNCLSSGGRSGGLNPLYQMGGPRSILALKLQV